MSRLGLEFVSAAAFWSHRLLWLWLLLQLHKTAVLAATVEAAPEMTTARTTTVETWQQALSPMMLPLLCK